ncbi:NADH-quinone oxidoreductase subunit NuoB [Candidatus Calescamantes bacterium]|nr:NADH-quinone oxidoreductase subunit NuoB [bacterium]MCK5223552.1 NADH-quinone oxidoreductase subunit NuoB [Candidatus Calescamantes bacterium]MCK5599321.1 NADH-quinone oxidoreductase subunit NuoB [bacterium]
MLNEIEQNRKERQSAWEYVINYFRKRSIWLLHYCTGCGAVELPPVMTSRWDLERFGVGPMATPRQADVFLVTGYASIKTLKRMIRTYEQMPKPRWVIGFGACTINGGIYYKSYNVINKLDRYIPVDIFISGCMPRPEAILAALEELRNMIQRGEAKGYDRYVKNYDWYKKNQKEILEREGSLFGEADDENK